MKLVLKYVVATFFGIYCFSGTASAQLPSYVMSNQTVDNCEGILTDSEAGFIAGTYANGENLIFTICVPGADSIIMNFRTFCTEVTFDSLRIFNGPDTNSAQIGITYSGDPMSSPSTVPDIVVARNGCMTLHFVSDAAGVTCDGWEAMWTTVMRPPDPPLFTPVANPTCSTTVMTVTLDRPVDCDSVYADAFDVIGPLAPTVIDAVAVNCSGGQTNTMQVTFSGDGLIRSGQYFIQFTSLFLDFCENVWELTPFLDFTINDCPLNVDIYTSADTICLGDCLSIEADASGGVSSGYNFSWSSGIPSSAGPHTICPVTTTTYSVTLTDGTPAPPATSTVTVTVLPPPTLTPDFSMCRSDPDVFLTGTPAGGYWNGPGLVGADTLSGRFRAWRANAGIHTVTYFDPNGCSNTMQIEVLDMWAGADEAACPGTPAFQVSSFRPAGGTWSGTAVTPGGFFDPTAAGIGTHDLIYTHPNGCSDLKRVRIDTITVQDDDTICINQGRYFISFSPYGGRWSGPALVSSSRGEFSPNAAGLGTHQLVYTILGSGCTDTLNIVVKDIDAGPDVAACPTQQPAILTGADPPGGVWSGIGVVDTITGLFDPSLGGGNYIDTVTYTVNGCTADRLVYVLFTQLGVDSLRLCENDLPVTLDYDNTQNLPPFGIWSGPGVTSPDIFDPAVAGPGTHILTYSSNTCSDNLTVVVTPLPTFITPPFICELSAPIDLQASPPGGRWAGIGIIDEVNGTFDPSVLGVGSHPVVYFTLPDSCANVFYVDVDTLPDVSFTGLDNTYCYKDSTIALTLAPQGGTLSGDGISGGNQFNPVTAGTGSHTITYTVGSGACAVSSSQSTYVGFPLSLTTSFDDTTVCFGEFVRIRVDGEGGVPLDYSFDWNNGQGTGQLQTLAPDITTTYTVTLSDECSDPVSANVTVTVQPEITVSATTNDIVCYGNEGFAQLQVSPADNYSYQWSNGATGDRLVAPVSTFYEVTVTNQANGCQTTETIDLPGYDRIRAFFQPNPNTGECLTLRNPEVDLLDLSDGAISGTWDFGDGYTEEYQFLTNPTHIYADTGVYEVILTVRNEGNCSDTYTQTICLEQEPLIFAPTAFSPNGDGRHDWYRVQTYGLGLYEMHIYNRWGTEVFFTDDPDKPWDGNFNAEKQPIGTYMLLIVYQGFDRPRKEFYRGNITLIR